MEDLQKPSVLSIIRIPRVYRVLFLLPGPPNSQDLQSIRLFWTMRCSMQTVSVFLPFLPLLSFAHSLPLTLALSNSPFFLLEYSGGSRDEVDSRANTYVERELFIVRMQGQDRTLRCFPKEKEDSKGKKTKKTKRMRETKTEIESGRFPAVKDGHRKSGRVRASGGAAHRDETPRCRPTRRFSTSH